MAIQNGVEEKRSKPFAFVIHMNYNRLYMEVFVCQM